MVKSSNTSTTVDEGEIERHSRLMADWWNLNGSIKGLHTYNNIRIPFIVNGLVLSSEKRKSSKPLANKKILDIGCGGGIVSEEHAQEFHNYYDAVVASEVIDHVANVDLFLKNCVETLKPGGKIFITAPNRTRLSQFWLIFVAEDVVNAIPKGTHRYENFVTPDEVKALLEESNCQVNNVHGICYTPILQVWSWSYFHSMLYALEATKLC